MGNGGSHAAGAGGGGVPSRQPLHWQHSLPSDPLLKASHLKVLPDLDSNPRLRSTNNGAILHSGGTISGRRPLSLALPPERDPMHSNNGVYRSKSINKDPYEGDRQPRFSYLSNQRDPLHRSQTHLHLEELEDSFAVQSKRFGSEPDLRNSQEPEITNKSKTSNKNVKKKYKAPPPPQVLQNKGESSSDSWREQQPREHPPPQVPSRKLRLFKTRAETKKNPKHNHEIKSNGFIHSKELPRQYQMEEKRHSMIDDFDHSRFSEREKILRSPSRERDEYLKYPSSREDDMIQTQSSLRREETILQTAFSRQEFLRTKHSQQNMYREKAKNTESRFDSNRAFRNSERFKKQNSDTHVLRREKSFDSSLVQELNHAQERLQNDRKNIFNRSNKFDDRDTSRTNDRLRSLEDEFDGTANKKVPSNGLASAEFQAELLMATRKLRSVNRKSPEKNITKVEAKTIPMKTESRVLNSGKIVKDKLERTNRTTEAKTNGTKPSPVVNKSNIVTLDRSKMIKPKDRPIRVVKEELKEEVKKNSKPNGVKVLPNDKVTRENNRNRRESRTLADRGQASGKESTPEQSPSRAKQETTWERNDQNQPCKSFYFGMDDNAVVPPEEELNAHEKVRRHLQMNYKDFPKAANYPVEEDVIRKTPINDYNTRLELPQGSSESALSSEPEMDDPLSEENNPHGIALQLRPTLPKKQLEIPRFSPAAAWRLLAALEADSAPVLAQTATPALAQPPLEERIERAHRPRPPRSTHDRSGDSGISGDAGPTNDECPDTPTSPVRREESSGLPLLSAWTPQQDLGEESGSDGGAGSPQGVGGDCAPARFSARPQLFSLSLPRDAHLAPLTDKNKQFQQPFNSLQKLRKSVSGALGAALGARKTGTNGDLEEGGEEETADDNWFLSRSAPNSLNNGLQARIIKDSAAKSHDSGQQQTPPSSDQEDERLPPVVLGMMRQQPPFSYLATGGHVMYLPQYDSQTSPQGSAPVPGPEQPYSFTCPERAPLERERPRHERTRLVSDGEMEETDSSKEKQKAFRDARQMSRSKSSGELILSPRTAPSKPRAKGKRFTFQSTVRQIERRRLSEKLSREAESKERQRLTELEAMRRVEEEFQRKRAREKASIRQQLRLVSMEESCSSLPSSWGGQGRAEPEGAVSPSPPPVSGSGSGSGGGSGAGSSVEGAPRAPATRVLSEYRQATREYRDYRRAPAAPTVHPPACYNMPRAPASRTGGWAAEAVGEDNYRREFARGRRAPSSSGSEQGSRLVTPPRATEDVSNENYNTYLKGNQCAFFNQEKI